MTYLSTFPLSTPKSPTQPYVKLPEPPCSLARDFESRVSTISPSRQPPRVRSTPERLQSVQRATGRAGESNHQTLTQLLASAMVISDRTQPLRVRSPLCASVRSSRPRPCHNTTSDWTHRSRVRSCVRSLFHSENHLLYFTNFTTLAQM
jgi:hypothetical protein